MRGANSDGFLLHHLRDEDDFYTVSIVHGAGGD